MKKISIQAGLRESTGSKHAATLRKDNKVPCILYGGDENISFWVDELQFIKLVSVPEVAEVTLDLGGTEYRGVLKDAQYHPVTDRPLHADFIQLFDDRIVAVNLPVRLEGSSEGVRIGGKLNALLRSVSVKGLPGALPEALALDITKLQIGDSIRVRDLNLEGIEVLDAPSAVIVSVKTSRKAMSEAAGGEGEEEGEEAATEEAAAE